MARNLPHVMMNLEYHFCIFVAKRARSSRHNTMAEDGWRMGQYDD